MALDVRGPEACAQGLRVLAVPSHRLASALVAVIVAYYRVVPIPFSIWSIQAVGLDVPHVALTRYEFSVLVDLDNSASLFKLLDTLLQLRVLANGRGNASAHRGD